MTPTLAEIEARLKAATPGPWRAHRFGGASYIAPSTAVWRIAKTYRTSYNAEANAAFVAHAPEDRAALLSLVRSRDARLAEIARVVKYKAKHYDSLADGLAFQRIHALATKEQA
jgi:hypothetical protein